MLCFPNAKINLGLYVTSRRPDGYHNLETLFVPIPLADALELTPLDSSNGKGYEYTSTGFPVDCDEAENLVVRVFRDLQTEFALPPCHIHLDKRVPMGAGLGGGSADAAFMMRMVNEAFSLGLSPDDMMGRMRKYGADCPFFILNRPAIAHGIGDELEPVSLDLSDYHLLLVKPSTSVSTREAYAHVHPQDPAEPIRHTVARPVAEWRNHLANDFEASVFLAHPDIAAIKQTLYDCHADYAAMSGSGSTVFALLRRPFDEASKVFSDCFVFQKPFFKGRDVFEPSGKPFPERV